MSTVNIMILDEKLTIRSFTTQAYLMGGRHIKFNDTDRRMVENGFLFRFIDDNGILCVLYGNTGGLTFKYAPVRNENGVDFVSLKMVLSANPKASLKEALLMSKI